MLALLEELDGPQVDWRPVVALFILWTLVWYWISSFLRKRLEALPAESRKLAPWVAYLLIIPGVNLLANFIVLIGTAQSYTKSFEAFGRELPGRESGSREAALYGIFFCLGVYPMDTGLQGIIWFIAIGSITLYLFKIHSLAQRFARIKINA